MLTYVNTAEHIVQRVIFVDAYHIAGGLTLHFYGHPDRDSEHIPKNGFCIGSQIICLLQKRQKISIQALGRTVHALNQTTVQVIQGNRLKFIDLGCFCQYGFPTFRFRICPRKRLCVSPKADYAHSRIPGNHHHSIRQHMDICFHSLS